MLILLLTILLAIMVTILVHTVEAGAKPWSQSHFIARIGLFGTPGQDNGNNTSKVEAPI